jgi:hypothetical protein
MLITFNPMSSAIPNTHGGQVCLCHPPVPAIDRKGYLPSFLIDQGQNNDQDYRTSPENIEVDSSQSIFTGIKDYKG